MIHTYTIPGRLISLNKYINLQRANKWGGASVKKAETERCAWACKKLPVITKKVDVIIDWYVPSKREDKDNIIFAKKFLLDGLVEAGKLKNDGWSEIGAFTEDVLIDKQNPRIEVSLREVTEYKLPGEQEVRDSLSKIGIK